MWSCTGNTNEELVLNLEKSGFIKSTGVREAMLATDRALYVPQENMSRSISANYDYSPYADAPQCIGHKATISAPYVHALALDALSEQLQRDDCHALDVGCGSGVLVACMNRMASNSQHSMVVGIDRVKELVDLSIKNCERDGIIVNNIDDGITHQVVLKYRDGWLGVAEHGPYDAIHCGASAPEVPESLLNQLKLGGRLVLPLGPSQAKQNLTLIEKHLDGTLSHTVLAKTRYVPLIKSKEALAASEQSDSKADIPLGVDYDDRYRKGWAYGKTPNDFLVTCMEQEPLFQHGDERMKPKSSLALSLGEGQGRNSVYLATVHNYFMVSIDISEVGLRKAKLLAEQAHATNFLALRADISQLESLSYSDLIIDEHVTEIADANSSKKKSSNVETKMVDAAHADQNQGYGLILSIFCMFSPHTLRSSIHSKCDEALQSGGLVIIECFSPNHLIAIMENNAVATANRSTPSNTQKDNFGDTNISPRKNYRRYCKGPIDKDMYVSYKELCDDFKNYDVLVAREVERELKEGKFHSGIAVLTQFMARKKHGRLNVTRDSFSDTSGSMTSFGYNYQRQIDEVFSQSNQLSLHDRSDLASEAVTSYRSQHKLASQDGREAHNKSNQRKDPKMDFYVSCAEAYTNISCLESERARICRYCWIHSGKGCLCNKVKEIADVKNASSTTFCTNGKTPNKLQWVFFVHPSEFLRSTSSVKMAVPLLDHAEIIVLGCKAHMSKLETILAEAKGLVKILYPEKNGEGYDTVSDVASRWLGGLSIPDVIPGDISSKHGPASEAAEQVSEQKQDLTVIVPDGSWAATAVLVEVLKDMIKHNRTVSSPVDDGKLFISLDELKVASVKSPLIEALRSGAGQGRISTLEACMIFFREMREHIERSTCNRVETIPYESLYQSHFHQQEQVLQKSLDVLVEYVREDYNVAALVSTPSASSVVGGAQVNAWIALLEAEAAKQVVDIRLYCCRKCNVCGVAFSTPIRMKEHIAGKKHCEAIIANYLQSSDYEEGEAEVDANNAASLFHRFSTMVLSTGSPEPPDVALMSLRGALNE